MSTKLIYSPSETTGQARTYTSINVVDKTSGVATHDWATTGMKAGESVLTSTKNTDGGVYSIRYAISDVKNVFNGTDVDPALWGPVKKGKTLLVKVRHTGKTQPAAGSAEIAVTYPLECGITFKYPVGVVNAEDLLKMLDEAVDAVIQQTKPEGGSTDNTSGLERLMRGAFPKN